MPLQLFNISKFYKATNEGTENDTCAAKLEEACSFQAEAINVCAKFENAMGMHKCYASKWAEGEILTE
ncbi:hypothetical protein PKNOH_S04356200 [Plasmodium knowlesi]|uniref:Uncharacterized protein n=1 Tax=Plasmodium knowlesi TaxID=5850 RepID=A0A1Y3DTT2_PLAKN|nr:hypothetical protein PKNOH_S04356200 [Plasmodium knowlesi]